MTTKSLLFATALAAAGPASAVTIFNDTFDSGVGDWRRAGTVGTLSNPGGALSWAQNGSENTEIMGRSFSATTLAVGETMRMTMNFTYSQGTATNNNIIRVGIYNLQNPIVNDGWSGGATNIGGTFQGYTTFVRDASATGNPARIENGTIDSAITHGPIYSGTQIGTNSTNYDINQDGTVNYTLVFEMTLATAGQMNTLFTLSSGATTHVSVSGTTATIYNGFNMAGLRSAEGTILADSILLEVIPEPSGVSLAGFGALALCIRRKRRA
jgi:hypothetical protein